MEQQVIDYRDPLAAHQLRCAVVALEEPMNVLRRWGSVERDMTVDQWTGVASGPIPPPRPGFFSPRSLSARMWKIGAWGSST